MKNEWMLWGASALFFSLGFAYRDISQGITSTFVILALLFMPPISRRLVEGTPIFGNKWLVLPSVAILSVILVTTGNRQQTEQSLIEEFRGENSPVVGEIEKSLEDNEHRRAERLIEGVIDEHGNNRIMTGLTDDLAVSRKDSRFEDYIADLASAESLQEVRRIADQLRNLKPNEDGLEEAISEAEEPFINCENIYTECEDNSDFANNYNGYSTLTVLCDIAAEDAARFGEPDLPGLSFGSFRTGDSVIRTGIATLIENEARFQNAFGTMQRARVVCRVDVENEVVLDLEVDPL